MALPSSDYAIATYPAPSADVDGFTLIVDESRLPAAYWADVNTTDGTRGRAAVDSTATELATDPIDFDNVADSGLRRIYVGTIYAAATAASRTIRLYAPNTRNTAYVASDTYGSDNAYDANWEGYYPFTDLSDRTSNGRDLTAYGDAAIAAGGGPYGGEIEIDGTDDYVGASSFTSTAVTVILWHSASWSYWGGPVPQMIREGGLTGNLAVSQGYDYLADPMHDVDAGTHATGDSSSWHHLAGVIGSTLASSRIRLDNSNLTLSQLRDTGITSRTIPVEIGRGVRDTYATGAIGPTQYHSVARSDDWLDHEYDQTNDQATFWGTWTWTTTGGGTPQELAGTLSAISALSGAIEISRALSGTLAGQSTASAALQVSRALAGQATAQSGITAALQITRTLSGALAGQSSAVGAVEVARTLAGVLAATSELSGDLSTVKLIDLAGTLEGSSSASGDILVERALSGTLSGTAEATAALEVIRELAGVLAGQAGASGNLQVGALVVYNEIVELAVQWAGDVAILVTWSGDTEIPVTWRET